MKKIRITTRQDLGEFATEVIVRTLDGNEFVSTVSEAKGSPNFPLSEGELLQKFVDCALKTMDGSQAQKAGRLLLNIDRENNLGTIMKSLCSQ